MTRAPYNAALAVIVLFSLLLFLVPQAFFLRLSLFRNAGMGEIGPFVGLENYVDALTDPFTLGVLLRTALLSLGAVILGLLLAAPTAYGLVRTRSRWLGVLIVLLLVSSFVSVVVKALGLQILLGTNGVVPRALRWLTFETFSPQLVYNDIGVVIGLVQYTLPLMVLMLFAVIQTIPASLEDAARVHGASDLGVVRRVLLPEAMPGLVVASLTAFNMNMGAFTSAALLGGGRVITMPILIQRKIVLDLDYPNAAVLCILLTTFVIAINLVASRFALQRLRTGASG